MIKKLLVLISLLLVLPAGQLQADALSTHERVIKSKQLRCGYTLYSVGLNRDPVSGDLVGIYKDITESIGRVLGLEVIWTEEVGWGEQIAGLNSNRYDMICSPVSMTPTRARAADFSNPLYYSPVYIWTRPDESRFDQGRETINRAETRISTIDGEQTSVMAGLYFPEATPVSLPQSSDFSQLMMNIISNKADITFAEPLTVNAFIESTGQKMKQLYPDKPLTVVPNIFLIKQNDLKFKAMINNALNILLLDGTIDRAIDKHETYPSSYIRVKGY